MSANPINGGLQSVLASNITKCCLVFNKRDDRHRNPLYLLWTCQTTSCVLLKLARRTQDFSWGRLRNSGHHFPYVEMVAFAIYGRCRRFTKGVQVQVQHPVSFIIRKARKDCFRFLGVIAAKAVRVIPHEYIVRLV